MQALSDQDAKRCTKAAENSYDTSRTKGCVSSISFPISSLTASSLRRILNLQAQSSIFNLCSIFKLQRPIVSCLISPPIKLSPTLQELWSSQETSIQEEVCHQKYKLSMVSCILFHSCSQHFWMSLLMMHIGSELMSSSCAAGWWVWTGEERHHGMRILRHIHLLSY